MRTYTTRSCPPSSPKSGVECYSCGQEGHMSLSCAQKSAKRTRRGAGGYGQQQQHQHACLQPAYPQLQQSFQHSARPMYAATNAQLFSPSVPSFPGPRPQPPSADRNPTTVASSAITCPPPIFSHPHQDSAWPLSHIPVNTL